MDHKFNYNADNNSDMDIKAREVVKKAFEESIRCVQTMMMMLLNRA